MEEKIGDRLENDGKSKFLLGLTPVLVFSGLGWVLMEIILNPVASQGFCGQHQRLQRSPVGWVPVVHACNPSYLRC
jgi:hypothetical protein